MEKILLRYERERVCKLIDELLVEYDMVYGGEPSYKPVRDMISDLRERVYNG